MGHGNLRRFCRAHGIAETVRTTKNMTLKVEIKLITDEDARHQTITGCGNGTREGSEFNHPMGVSRRIPTWGFGHDLGRTLNQSFGERDMSVASLFQRSLCSWRAL